MKKSKCDKHIHNWYTSPITIPKVITVGVMIFVGVIIGVLEFVPPNSYRINRKHHQVKPKETFWIPLRFYDTPCTPYLRFKVFKRGISYTSGLSYRIYNNRMFKGTYENYKFFYWINVLSENQEEILNNSNIEDSINLSSNEIDKEKTKKKNNRKRKRKNYQSNYERKMNKERTFTLNKFHLERKIDLDDENESYNRNIINNINTIIPKIFEEAMNSENDDK
ncbi:hypothetical protein H8356DRAFT_1419772 [Neocallimastix lanati (nom. inval.)]|nr:hypothetical protein H8356DRAFT_1419772 [Neocallimastix sp. JGI-2020a]